MEIEISLCMTLKNHFYIKKLYVNSDIFMHYNIKPFFIKKLYENIDIFVHDNKNHFLYKKNV